MKLKIGKKRGLWKPNMSRCSRWQTQPQETSWAVSLPRPRRQPGYYNVFSQIASCRLDSLQNPLLYQRWMANRDIFTYLLPTSKNAIKLIFLIIIFTRNYFWENF